MLLLLLLLAALTAAQPGPLPVVTWHGVGGTAAECDSLISTIHAALPGLPVHNVAVGSSPDMDHANSILMRCMDQVDLVCEQLLADPTFSAGYNAVGISQGGLLIRALVQRCPIPVRTLITFGSPHQGVFGVPDCRAATGMEDLCELVRQLLSAAAYEPWLQNLITPAQYWHDPLNTANYQAGSSFLALVNNEREPAAEHRERMEALRDFVMVMWDQDTTVIPKESAHFQFYRPGQDQEVQPLEQSKLYTENYIGLRTLNEAGKLHFYNVSGHHVQFDYEWVAEHIVPWLLP